MEQVKVLGKLHQLSERVQEQDDNKHRWQQWANERLVVQLDSLKLPHSGRKMLAVLHQEGGMNQRNLAQKLGISPQAVSETVKKLETQGCITKVSGNQKNENLISLTPLGEELALLLFEIISHHAQEVFEGFTSEEVALLGKLLDKLLERQSEQEAGCDNSH